MKERIIAVLPLAILFLTILFTACPNGEEGDDPPAPPPPPPPTGKIETTNLGFIKTTDTVKKPSQDVTISVFSDGKIAEQDFNELNYNSAFVANSVDSLNPITGTIANVRVGDVVHIESDYKYIKVEMFGLLPAILYSPTGEFVFQIPAGGTTTPVWDRPYPPGTFTQASNTLKASVATDAEIQEARNLALNPYDFLYKNELNTLTGPDDTAPLNSLPVDSVSVDNGEVIGFPHAYANRITSSNDRPSFLPRNAIDGVLTTGNTYGHINYGGHSWGGGKFDDLAYTVYFGREVTLTELSFVMRADYSGTPEHDTYWEEITVEFSDGSEELLDGFEKGPQKQTREITPVKTTFLRLKDFKRHTDPSNADWAALIEIEAVGSDSAKNSVATKTTIKNTFGGKKITYKTNAYSASEIKEYIDFACNDVRDVVRIKNSSGVSENWWRDGVLFSALMDAYTTTGTLDQYLYMQYAADKYKYQMKRNEGGRGCRSANVSTISIAPFTGSGQVTDFADDYLVGETWLWLDDLKPAMHKRFNVYANADANMKNRPSWDAQFNLGNGFSGNNNTKWTRPNPDNVFDWWWCDAIYMGLNYFTLMGNATGDSDYIEKAYRSYQHWKGILACNEDSEVHGKEGHGKAEHGGNWALWHRDTDLANYQMNNQIRPTSAAVPTFWARGNAWVFAGLAKQMLYIDQTSFPEIYNTYKDDFIAMATTLKYYQHEKGYWRASVIDPTHGDHGDEREATGTSGYVYGLAIGVQLGILDGKEYWPVIEKAFDQLLGMRLEENGRLGYMQDVGYDAAGYPGEAAGRTGTNAFGYGLFIHAASAIMRMCTDYVAPELLVPSDGQYGVAKVADYAGVRD